MSRKPLKFLKPILFLIAAIGFSLGPAFAAKLELTETQQKNWARFWEEHQANKLMIKVSSKHHPGTMAFIDLNVIPMTSNEVLAGYTVIVEDGKIFAIGPKEEIDIPEGAGIFIADDYYLLPGLTEGHAHTQVSLSQFLVYLTRGVTTVREMDGFPWMLRARDQAREGELLIPNLYVAGHILSNRAWNFYMTQVNTEDQARELVRQQAADGYDFIKIHNSMPEPMFSAIFDEAKKAGLDVVGHIPNEILIKDAIAAGMRTNEHFKGYLYDMTLEITTQDYLSYTGTSDLWNAPSFSNHHDHLRGAEALKLVTEENSLRLVPRWLRNSWLMQAEQPLDGLTKLRQTILPKSKEIFTNLLQFTDKFFAGTDTGTYAFQVPGYALQEEIRIFEDFWFSSYRGLKTATINPAIAMRKEAEMGTIEVGKRADLLIVGANPLEGNENLADVKGVMVRGIWLEESDLKSIEDRLEAIFSEDNEIPQATTEALISLVSEMETLKEAGFPYPDYALEEVENLLNELSLQDLAGRVDALQARQGVPIQTP